MKKSFCRCGGLLLALAACSPSQASSDQAQEPVDTRQDALGAAQLVELEAAVDSRFQAFMEANHLPGGAVVVVHEGTTLFTKAYGLADVAQRVQVDSERTLFRIGSISKALTLLTLARLVDEGRLSYDTDVAEYFPDMSNPNGFRQPVTVRHLMTHTTGFDQIGIGRQIGAFDQPLSVRQAYRPTLEEFLNDGNLRRVSPAGVYSRYDTYGTTLAGALLEKVTGLDYAAAMQQEMFGPLGMGRTFVETEEGFQDDLALGYGFVDGAYVPQPYEVYLTRPASSIDGTISDMGLLLEALTGDGSSRDGRLFGADMAEAVRQAQFRPHPDFLGYTHGLRESWVGRERLEQPLRAVGHGGDMLGFSSQMLLIPELGIGIFATANRNGEAGGGFFRAGDPVMEAVLDVLPSTSTPSPKSVPERVVGQDLSEYTGTYRYGVYCHSCTDQEFAQGGWRPSTEREVTDADGALRIGDQEFLPLGDDVFVQSDGARRVFFGRDDSGRVTYYLYSTSVDTFERVLP